MDNSKKGMDSSKKRYPYFMDKYIKYIHMFSQVTMCLSKCHKKWLWGGLLIADQQGE